MRILYDSRRHLITVPYSAENLHRAAQQLGIKRCWFHKDHYDIPKRMIARMSETVAEKVSPREILKIVRGSESGVAKHTEVRKGESERRLP